MAVDCDRRGADSAIPHDDGGYALGNFGQHLRRANRIQVVMCVRVDETGRKDIAFPVQGLIGGVSRKLANALNEPATNANIYGLQLAARAI